ncbi:MAG TPA: alpha-L-fucosidase [Gemmatimonadales bacterium]|nr:alpha-L-fucosidase [Gemmatimonadales bacterium]
MPRPSADDRLAWWQEARFGMFVHFGLYSILGGEWNGKPAGTHEWIRNNARIPNPEYARLVRRFNPVDFDAEALAALAAAAGQRYLVFTAKHHDGFSLFDSRHTDYGMMATPARRDLAREVATACRRHGIVPCWYYSIMDWNHPDYLPRREWEAADRPAGMASFSRYLEFMLRQMEELLTRYGDIGLLWFDGQWEGTWTHERAIILAERCRALSPRIIINNRVDKAGPNPFLPGKYARGSDQWRSARSAGDYSTPELDIPDAGVPGEPWESCITMNDNWGYSRFDTNFKSTARLVEILVETASKGGNLLLNVGPDGTGRIPEQSVRGLREIGAWMAVHGEAIHGTTGSPMPEAGRWS